ncbi:MAG: ABC transporter permease [Phenylobacterium sp.]|uniref:ABC transporter permease n=5 Tax=Phenylobacterium sp. TaxID=1871053 RepID=UPI0025D3C354|nr:ABC transporter permease [Phenylobacterium sp.]MCA3715746.1 ABC transporter permease [Phenylobacterium sp.]MCA3725016.1 ABC transporter permease [Phenylobacterium sp.]MCA3725933.1 ABC transporter permease [Phenylobacterium sp.]MCA3728907.1 ABC transporter permease [Phenylobacterium sp.]MCA3732130.1 ABC transporter permease [Phenylobacterium sp.]
MSGASPAEIVRFAAGAIIAHPLRSGLTSLGVVIGVAAVVMMTSIGLGAQKRVTDTISGLGSNLIIVTPLQPRTAGGVMGGAGSGQSLSDADTVAIQRQVQGAAAVAPSVTGMAQVTADGANWNTSIVGVTPEYLEARDLTVASGRMFDDRDARQGRKVAVLGPTVVTQLWGEADPIGKRIRIRGAPFEVVGVLGSKGQSSFGRDQDDLILAPLETVRSRIIGRRIKADSVQTIYVKAVSEEELGTVQEEIDAVLRAEHKIQPGEDDDFQTQNLASILEASRAAIGAFTVLLAAIAAVSLVVGGVGIMNIMLVAVTERTREIGLRMALGARRRDVLTQFALESVALSLVGGLIGLGIGLLGAAGIAAIGNWPFALPVWAIPVALSFSSLVGLVFGAYPAWRAARLDPIEALRRE